MRPTFWILLALGLALSGAPPASGETAHTFVPEPVELGLLSMGLLAVSLLCGMWRRNADA